MEHELKIGQKWQFTIHKDNPWKEDNTTVAVIKDLKDGWVRFIYEGLEKFNDLREDIFRSTYITLKEDVK